MTDRTTREEPASRGYYPVFLDVRGRRCVVVGGGTVSEQKSGGLLESGARVTVVSPALTARQEALVAAGRLEARRRRYRGGDLAGAFLAIVVPGDPAVTREVWAEAEARGIPLNAVDDPAHSSFIAPAIHRQGELTVAVSTAGRAPALAVRLRDRIASIIGPEYGEFLVLAGAVRDRIAARVPDFEARRRLWYEIVDSDVLKLLRDGDAGSARKRLEQLIDGPRPSRAGGAASPGVVYLVGAGPGDPGLITAKGLEILRRADVVVYDRLVHAALLDEAPPAADRIFVGKLPGDHGARQESINRLMIAEARCHRVVVRLKGGDPFVFGRGAEECEALYRAGVPFEVVPGVTAAISVPAAAGIPVTHRRYASGFAVVAGHECDGDSDLDWGALARLPALVVLMGLRSLPVTAARLIASGADPASPAAVIAGGTLEDQRTVVGSLATIVELVEGAGLEPPATLVVGEVVRVRALLGGPQTTRRKADRSGSPFDAGLAEASAALMPEPRVRHLEPVGESL